MKKSYEAYLGHQDVLLQSFPRSGNTWTRLLIATYIKSLESQKKAKKNDIQKPDMSIAFEIIPSLEKIDFDNQTFTDLLPYKLVKSHHISDAPHCRTIYIYRHPADSLRSYVRYIEKRPLEEISTERTLEIISRSIPKWERHCHYALKSIQTRNKNEFHVRSYELLKADTLGELKKILEFLDIEYKEELALDIIKINRLQNTIENHKNTGTVKKNYFWNEGQVGLGKKFIEDCDLTLRINELEKLWSRLNKLVENNSISHF